MNGPAGHCMQEFFLGWGFTAAALGLITLVFFIATARMASELRYIRDLTDYLGYDLVAPGEGQSRPKPMATLRVDEIRDQVKQVAESTDPVWALKQVRGWEMRAQRLEPALAFWVDLLRQLGLLGTVVGLGLSMLIERTDVTRLLGPLGLAVWTTIFGLAYSIYLSAQYSGKMAAWADACEKNLEAWQAQRRIGRHRS